MRYRIRTLQGIAKVADEETDSLDEALEAARDQRELFPKGNVTINDTAERTKAGWHADVPIGTPEFR